MPSTFVTGAIVSKAETTGALAYSFANLTCTRVAPVLIAAIPPASLLKVTLPFAATSPFKVTACKNSASAVKVALPLKSALPPTTNPPFDSMSPSDVRLIINSPLPNWTSVRFAIVSVVFVLTD